MQKAFMCGAVVVFSLARRIGHAKETLDLPACSSPTRRSRPGWVILTVRAVHFLPRKVIRFRRRRGRRSGKPGVVSHELPAVLTPNGPLSKFITDAFGINLSDQQTFDLATLVGRQFESASTRA